MYAYQCTRNVNPHIGASRRPLACKGGMYPRTSMSRGVLRRDLVPIAGMIDTHRDGYEVRYSLHAGALPLTSAALFLIRDDKFS